MAIQDFVAGGFYGKVGQLVGQRWKNKRTVRSYVIPHNPRTELQQSNRLRFAEAVQYAQLGLVFNKGASVWESAGLTEFQRRVSQAKRAVDSGLSDWSAVPLYPTGTSPDTTLSDVRRIGDAEGQLVLASVTLASLAENRRFFFQVCIYNTETEQWELVNIISETTAGSNQLCSETIPLKYRLSEGVTIFGITNDDSDHEGKFVYIPPQSTEEQPPLVVDDLAISYPDENTLEFVSNNSRALTASYTLTVTYEVTDACTQTKTTKTAVVETVVGGSYWFRIPTSWYYSMKGLHAVSAVVTDAPAGAREISVPSQDVIGGKKYVSGHVSAGVCTLQSTDRQRGNVVLTLERMFTNVQWSASCLADYTSFDGGVFANAPAGNRGGTITASSTVDVAADFESCPTPETGNKVSVDFAIDTEYINLTAELSSQIADATATMMDLRIWNRDSDRDYAGFVRTINATEYAALSALVEVDMLAWGENVKTGVFGTDPERARLTFRNDGSGGYTCDFELSAVYPVSAGTFQLVQVDYRTAASVYYFRGETVSMGKITSCGMQLLIESLFSPAEPSLVTFASGVGSGTWGVVQSEMTTTFANRVLQDSTIEMSSGSTVIPGSATFYTEPGTPPLLKGSVSVDVPVSGQMAYAEIGLAISNAVFDIEEYFTWEE